MNAYELAEKLKHWSGNRDELWESADILIEQAKRIEELEKDIHKELSDEEIWKIYNITGLGKGMAVRFARAIEERHGIK